MAQYLKEDVRERILAAALEIFALNGYEGARMADIAAHAEISSGNIYRYYANKDVLFYAIVDRAFAVRLLKLIRERVRTLRPVTISEQNDDATQSAEQLLDFWIAHRLKVVVILSRMKGTNYENFADKVVHELTKITVLRGEKLGYMVNDPENKFLLDQIFHGSVQTIVRILSEYSHEETIRRLIQKFWHFQIAGLQGFFSRAPQKLASLRERASA